MEPEFRLAAMTLPKSFPVLGAEATIEFVDWYGMPAIRKYRIPKSYRVDEIDRILRSKRTKEEVEILHASKQAGVDCPTVFFADPTLSEIVMEYVPGILVKDLDEDSKGIFDAIGQRTGLLHCSGIIHGDLTTKNIIISGERLVFIDFGLSFFSPRIEDKAEDLHLLKQALKSSLPMKKAAVNFSAALNGYEEIVGKNTTDAVKRQIALIELRGRYAQVD